MVGGRDYWNPDDRFARVNLATGGITGRQAGSAFKPFALVAALEHGVPRSQPPERLLRHILLQDGNVLGPEERRGRRLRDDLARERDRELGEHRVREPARSAVATRTREPRHGRGCRADGDPVLSAHHRAERPARGRPVRGPRRERGQHARDGVGVRHARDSAATRSPRPWSASRTRTAGHIPGEAAAGAGRHRQIAAEAVDILKGVVGSGTGTGGEHRPSAVRQDRHCAERERRLVRRSRAAVGRGGVGRVPAGTGPDVLRQRPDLHRLRRHVAGIDLEGLHARGDRPDADPGVRRARPSSS